MGGGNPAPGKILVETPYSGLWVYITMGTGGHILRTADISKNHIKSNFDDMKTVCPEMKRSRSKKNKLKFLNIFWMAPFGVFVIRTPSSN